MSKGKKARARASKYTSKGAVKNVKQKTLNGMRKMNMSDKIHRQLAAHRAGKHTMITVENPNKEETNKRFIRIPGKDYFKKEMKAK
jgi:hypothetical protein